MKTFFIADTHFGDKSIFRYENRPFTDVDEMDQQMISLWNAVVSPEDIVYHLGDFGGDGRESQILSQLNGIMYLVKGNHGAQSNSAHRDFGFSEDTITPSIWMDFGSFHTRRYMSIPICLTLIFSDMFTRTQL